MKNFWNIVCFFVYVRNIFVDIYRIGCCASLMKQIRNGKDVSDKIVKMLESELRHVDWEFSFCKKHDCCVSRYLLGLIQKTMGDEVLITYYDMMYMYKPTALQVY